MRHRLTAFSTSNHVVRGGDATGLIFNIGDIPGPFFDVTGINATADYHDLLTDDNVDGIILCAPATAHLHVAMDVAEAGKPCFIEKPIAMRASDGRQIVQAFRSKKVPVVVGHVLPSFPEFGYLRNQILQAGIGNVTKLAMTRKVAKSRTDDEKDTVSRGGFALDLGVHDANFITGLDTPVTVKTRGSSVRYEQYQWMQFEIGLQNSDGVFICTVGAAGNEGFHHSYEAEFQDGTAIRFDGNTVWRNDEPVELTTKSIPRVFGDELEIAARFFRGEGDASFLDAGVAMQTLTVLEAAQESAKTKQPITL